MTRVLLVEPDAARRDRGALALRQARFEVRSAGDAESGLRMVSESRPDLLVVDALRVGMPLAEFVSAARAAAAGVPVAVVALLAPHASAADAHQAILDGADDALAGGCDPEAIVEAVRARERRLPPASTSAPSGEPALAALERAVHAAHRPVTVAALALDDAAALAAVEGAEALRELDESWRGRLRGLLPDQATLIPGIRGEATVVLPGSTPDLRATIAALSGTGQAPARIGGWEFRLRAAVGTVTVAAREQMPSTEVLLARTRHALRIAQRGPQPRVRAFEPGAATRALEEQRLATMLQQSLEQGAFRLAFQPKVRIADGETIGAEALIRWNLPTTGEAVPARRLLAAADEAGLLTEIGSWAVREACRQCAAWCAAGVELPVSVNLAPSQFRRGDLVDEVRLALGEAALPGRLLCLEVPESVLATEEDIVRPQLEELRTAGTSISMDDFGTGIAGMALLRRMPIDEVKVDGSVVGRLPGSSEDRATLDAVLRHARQLNVRCVAEGVERADQWALLAERGWQPAHGWQVAQTKDGGLLPRFARRDPEAVAVARRTRA